MNNMDHTLKELGELYAFNREIQRFEFTKNAPYETTESSESAVAEASPEYKTGSE